MNETENPVLKFEYEAQTREGTPMRGAIHATDLDAARTQLESLGLRVLSMDQPQAPVRAKALRGSDFVAFNQQLAHLTKAGLPIEHGLRMVARDVGSRRLAHTIEQVADELDRGRPLPEAFDAHRRQFPAFYGRLIDAGIKANNLAGVLLSLGRHLEMINRLRAVLWRSLTYPLVVLLFVLFVVGLICVVILPQFSEIYKDFDMELPLTTKFLVEAGNAWPTIFTTLVVAFASCCFMWPVLLWLGWDRQFIDECVLPFPLIGPVLKHNLVARWCDTMSLCLSAGMDLPGAIRLSGEAVGSPALMQDGEVLVSRLESGRPISDGDRPRILSATVVTAMELSENQQGLASTLETLSDMSQQQADMRLSVAHIVISPILLVFIAFIVGFVVIGLFMPLVNLMSSM